MHIIILACIVATIVAVIVRSVLPDIFLAAAASGSAAMVATQLAAGLDGRHPVYFQGQDIAKGILAGMVIGGLGTCVGFTLRRVIAGPPPPSREAPSAGHRWGAAAAVLGLMALAGPYLSMGALGSAPLATIDPTLCAVLAAVLVGWLAALHIAERSLAIALGCLASCLTALPVACGPQYILGDPVTLVGAWPLAVAGAGMLASSIAGRAARLRAGGAPRSEWLARVAVPLIAPVLLLAALAAAAVVESPTARATLHPTARSAFAEWAELNWREIQGQKIDRWDSDPLRNALMRRVDGYPRWWAAALPGLLEDPAPAIRCAAVTAMGWDRKRTPWPDGALARVMRDPEARIRNQALDVATVRLDPPPDDAALAAALVGTFAVDRSVADFLLEPWLGPDRLVAVYAEAIATATGPALERVAASAARNPARLAAVSALVAAERDPRRRVGLLDLIRNRDAWVPPPAITACASALMDDPGPVGLRAADTVLGLLRRNPAPVPLADTLRAGFLLLGARQRELTNGVGAFERAQPGDILASLRAALASADPRQVGGALWCLWDRDCRRSAGQEVEEADLWPQLLPIIHGGDTGLRREAVLIALARWQGLDDARTAARSALASHPDAVVRMIAAASAPHADAPPLRLVQRVEGLLWDSRGAVRDLAATAIATAETDPGKAIGLLEGSGEDFLRYVAQQLREEGERRAKSSASGAKAGSGGR